mmetsp:Transcript_19335/g.27560  ORF Transcript_19335/g.27560 Transcript_19335/m.27560 type:complete len:252 (-) Transcript_19335:838-1593(-)
MICSIRRSFPFTKTNSCSPLVVRKVRYAWTYDKASSNNIGTTSSSVVPPPLIMASLVPIVLENSGLGERSFDIYSRLLRERIICVHGEVTDAMASVVTAQLLFLEAESPEKPLAMYINSPGGVITAGMAIYDTMQYVSPIVSTICMGQAASMGSLLLAGGSAGHRYSLPNARIMVHQPRGGASGVAADIDIQAREILRMREMLNNLYAHHTQQPLAEIERKMDRDSFMSPEEAIQFGLIDKILHKRDAANI